MKAGKQLLDASSRFSKRLFKKILSLAVSFNSLMAAASAGRNLLDFYLCGGGWRPYSPYLLDGNLLWAAVLSSLVNIRSSVKIGKVRIKRILFHHYVWGFIVLIISSLLLLWHYSLSPLQLFTEVYFTGDYRIFVFAFLIMGGITLILDDLQDIRPLNGLLTRLSINPKNHVRALRVAKYLFHTLSIYISLSILLWLLDHPWRLDPSWVVYIGSLFINGLLGFVISRDPAV
ncbi:hypothetical protein DRO56_00625 [Candidatus Bathyarchaeota archaeon]|nr:MAG: hypothetical protein DRO56_00625 [Candidatus Bathyarchaeota archaeon]